MKKWILMLAVLIISVPGMLQADDTEIYGTVASVSLEPNVLIHRTRYITASESGGGTSGNILHRMSTR
jgi:hypothetical protein